jgi:hypothetical protein
LKKCFKFTKENSSSLGIVYRPIVKVGLKDANGEPFELSVLVDSGADISIFSRRIGDIMGINVEQGEEKIFRGIVGELIAYVHPVKIKYYFLYHLLIPINPIMPAPTRASVVISGMGLIAVPIVKFLLLLMF